MSELGRLLANLTTTRTQKPTVGDMPFVEQLGIPPTVWAKMGPKAQDMATRAGKQRHKLRNVPGLGVLCDHMRELISQDKPYEPLSASRARAAGIDVLLEGKGGDMVVGQFGLPPLDGSVVQPPKTFDFQRPTLLLLLPQRIELAYEFVRAVTNGTHGSGVLLSGPNGVGKSGVGVLTYLLCAHMGLPVVYIPSSKVWVSAARRGDGDAFFVETFWCQNADLIAASEPLHAIFEAVLQDRVCPEQDQEWRVLTTPLFKKLLEAVKRGKVAGLGVISDEVQCITEAVVGDGPMLSAPLQLAAAYFASSWHDWDNAQRVFARMSIASSHGARELKLPSGEDHRLRFVHPLPPELAATLQTNESSPAFVTDKRLREYVAFIAGGVLRSLVKGADLTREMPKGPHSRHSKEFRTDLLRELWVPMEEDCSRWLNSIHPEDRGNAATRTMDLVRGKLSWGRAKQLYDDGLVARISGSSLVEPVSPVAAAVIMQTMAAHMRGKRVSLGSKIGAERGYELERQLHTGINPCDTFVPAKHLDGSRYSSLQLKSHYTLVFKDLTDVVPQDDAVAYLPHSTIYPCDAILVPAADDAISPIIVLEASVTSPLDSNRVAKVRKWFCSDGIVTKLRTITERTVLCALIWNESLSVSKAPPGAVALSRGMGTDLEKVFEPGAAIGEQVVVIDLEGIVLLGIIP
jgi:hypothetical protein